MMSRGCKQVALFGLCSGAYTAFHTAVVDRRVAAIMPVNAPGFHFNDADSLALAIRCRRVPWMRAHDRLLKWLRVPRKQSGDGAARQTPSLLDDTDDVARGFGKYLERGGKALLVYGTANPGLPVLEGHLGPRIAKARGEQNLNLELVEGSDHTFTPRIAQKRLRSLLTWFFDRALP
jgi:hypothetical protein